MMLRNFNAVDGGIHHSIERKNSIERRANMYSEKHTKITIFHTEKIFHKLINSCPLIRIAKTIAHSIELKKFFNPVYTVPFFTS